MNTVEQIVKNESLDDIVTVFALFQSASHVDRMIGRYNPEALNNGELLKVYKRLFENGILTRGTNGHTAKGPNWKAPKFALEKRYT